MPQYGELLCGKLEFIRFSICKRSLVAEPSKSRDGGRKSRADLAPAAPDEVRSRRRGNFSTVAGQGPVTKRDDAKGLFVRAPSKWPAALLGAVEA
jgi:hypothetical protein